VSGPAGYDLSPDGELAYVSDHDKDQATSTNGDIWVVSLKDGKPKNLTESNKAFDGTPRYSPDGKWIAYRRQAKPGYESDKFELWLYDRKAHTSKALTASFDNWVEDFTWARDSGSLVFEAPVDGVTPLYKVTLDGTVTKLFEGKTITQFALAGESPVVVMNAVDKPPELYAGGKALTHLNDALAADVDLRGAEAMKVGEIQVFVVKPHDFDPKKKYPLILNVHGGPQYMWSDSFRGEYQIFPGAGYVMAFANPHGSTGYGQAFTSEISGDFGGKVYDDLMAVTDALEKLPYVDKTKMGAMGWSYGGYMMAWFEGHTDRFKALVSMMGIYDLKAFWGETEELWFPEWDLKGTAISSPDYDKFSPSSYAKNFKSPMLVLTGEHDYRIPYTQSLELFTALQRENVPSKLIVYETSSHWPGWYEMALYYTAHLEWFHKYLGGAAGPWTTDQFARNAVFDSKTGDRLKGR
jgi:dipeptidyl aminopeptidase/acylaminoacyl peptidase